MKCKPGPHDLLAGFLLTQSLLERRSDALFQPFGLTSAQFNILNLLGRREGRMEQAELVESLLVGKSSVSIVLNRMVRDELIKRAEHPTDRRQVVLALTAKGRSLWRKITPLYEASVERVFGKLPVSHRQQFLEDLRAIYGAFLAEEGSAEPGGRWEYHFSHLEDS